MPRPFVDRRGITLGMAPRSGSGLIALRIPAELDDRLRAEVAATGSTLSDYVREAIETSLSNGTPAKPAKRAGGKCPHGQRTGAFCRKCEGLVP